MSEVRVSGWVRSVNVQHLFRWLSLYVGYGFDETDWQAIAAARPDTDNDTEQGWYEYPVAGSPPLVVAVAQSIGADPVMVSVTGDMDAVLSARVDTLLSVMAEIGSAEWMGPATARRQWRRVQTVQKCR